MVDRLTSLIDNNRQRFRTKPDLSPLEAKLAKDNVLQEEVISRQCIEIHHSLRGASGAENEGIGSLATIEEVHRKAALEVIISSVTLELVDPGTTIGAVIATTTDQNVTLG